LNEGKAINISINAGVIVQINSTNVPCVIYLFDIFDFLNCITSDTNIQLTANNIIAK